MPGWLPNFLERGYRGGHPGCELADRHRLFNGNLSNSWWVWPTSQSDLHALEVGLRPVTKGIYIVHVKSRSQRLRVSPTGIEQRRIKDTVWRHASTTHNRGRTPPCKPVAGEPHFKARKRVRIYQNVLVQKAIKSNVGHKIRIASRQRSKSTTPILRIRKVGNAITVPVAAARILHEQSACLSRLDHRSDGGARDGDVEVIVVATGPFIDVVRVEKCTNYNQRSHPS